eukprot:383101-Rhodomonas_salina.1
MHKAALQTPSRSSSSEPQSTCEHALTEATRVAQDGGQHAGAARGEGAAGGAGCAAGRSPPQAVL